MGEENTLPIKGKKIPAANWSSLSFPRRKYVILYAVLSLVMVLTTIALPSSFIWDRPSWVDDYELSVVWLWGSTDLSGGIIKVITEYKYEYTLQGLTNADIIFIIMNILSFLLLRFGKRGYLALVCNSLLVSTVLWAIGFMVSSMIFGWSIPGANAVVVLVIAVVMRKTWRYIKPTETEKGNLERKYQEIEALIPKWLENNEIIFIQTQLRELARDALAYAAYDIHFRANTYKGQLMKIGTLYSFISQHQPVNLDQLKTTLALSEANFSSLIMGISRAFGAEIAGNKITFKGPIDVSFFVSTAKKMIEEFPAHSAALRRGI